MPVVVTDDIRDPEIYVSTEFGSDRIAIEIQVGDSNDTNSLLDLRLSALAAKNLRRMLKLALDGQV
jgi:hypothetical protein